VRKPYPQRARKSLAELFWARVCKVDGDGCWEWQGCVDENGYATMNNPAFSSRKCSRIAYFLHYGEFDKSLNVLHTCDNPRCVRIDHLYLGTQKRNGEDMKARKRSSWGSRNGQSKLTDAQVLEIRARLDQARGEHGAQTDIAKAFGITASHVCRIASGEAWAQL